MYPRSILPEGFEPPLRVETDRFVIVPITHHRVTQDMEGISKADLTHMTNDDHVTDTHGAAQINEWVIGISGNNWVLRNGILMPYMVMNKDETKELGCIYFYESIKAGYDVDAECWARVDGEDDLDEAILAFTRTWADEFWPFKRVAYPGRDIPWSEWEQMPDKNPPHWHQENPNPQSIILPKMVPDGFEVPMVAETADFYIAPMFAPNNIGVDFEAHNDSVDAIRQQLPGLADYWPRKNFPLEEQLYRLGYEGRNFIYRNAFAYSIYEPNPDYPRSLGALHIKRTHKLGYEAELFIWVRATEMDTGLRDKTYAFAEKWIAEAWPFAEGKVLMPGHNISWDEWRALPETEAIQWK